MSHFATTDGPAAPAPIGLSVLDSGQGLDDHRAVVTITEAQETEFDRWYNEEHVPEVLQLLVREEERPCLSRLPRPPLSSPASR